MWYWSRCSLGWLVLAGHDILPEGKGLTTFTSMLEELCAYAKDTANGILIAPIEDIAMYVDSQRDEKQKDIPVYLVSRQPIDSRVEDLLGRMTLEEKIGQMNMPCIYVKEMGADIESKTEGCIKFTEGVYEEEIGPGGGFFTLANRILQEGPQQQAKFFNELQRIAIEETRLKIPLLQTEEGTHGLMCAGGTIFPEVFLPPWEAGIKKSGALGVMATYPAIDGVPVHGSEKILTTILREELGFKGLVLGEGLGLTTLLWEKVVKTQKEAGVKAINVGVDVGITYEPAFMQPMVESVKEGKVNIETINRAVRRILRLKFQLGLFEEPYVDIDYAVKTRYTKENQELALRVAREGIVLLKNSRPQGVGENLLPLSKDIKSIAIIGPNADHERNQLGDYTSRKITQDIVTVLEGVKKKVSAKTKITYVKGCNIISTDFNEIREAQKAAKKADMAVVVVGESERYSIDKPGTNGEGKDVASLDLTGLQGELIRAVYETGTPTIVILNNGRPLSTRWVAGHIPAIIEAWNCGEKDGDAIADVLFGDHNPSGKLPITVPRHSGQLPMYYNYYPTKEKRIKQGGYVDMSASPLYEFGFGLSYTTFEYSNLQISPESIGAAGNVSVSIDVKNTGNREGSEVVQLYINDVISSIVTPIKELKGFEKNSLDPGEKETVHFTLSPEDLAYVGLDMKPVVEPGEFKVMVGSSCEDIRVEGFLTVKN